MGAGVNATSVCRLERLDGGGGAMYVRTSGCTVFVCTWAWFAAVYSTDSYLYRQVACWFGLPVLQVCLHTCVHADKFCDYAHKHRRIGRRRVGEGRFTRNATHPENPSSVVIIIFIIAAIRLPLRNALWTPKILFHTKEAASQRV